MLGEDITLNYGDVGIHDTAAEVRFWLFDEPHFPGPAAQDFRSWLRAVIGSADQARTGMQLPATAAPGAQTGVDVLLAEGLAREL